MLQKFSINLRLFFAILIAGSVAYFVLLNDNALHTSISSIIFHTRHLAHRKHLLVLGLLPIYISLIIFGSASLALYANSRLEQLLSDRNKSHV